MNGNRLILMNTASTTTTIIDELRRSFTALGAALGLVFAKKFSSVGTPPPVQVNRVFDNTFSSKFN